MHMEGKQDFSIYIKTFKHIRTTLLLKFKLKYFNCLFHNISVQRIIQISTNFICMVNSKQLKVGKCLNLLLKDHKKLNCVINHFYIIAKYFRCY